MCARNRTKVGCDQREETQGLLEIDSAATEAEVSKLSDDARLTLDIVRTGSAWNRTAAFWAGQADSKTCLLCGIADEGPTHFWSCCALKEVREQVDPDLSQIDPNLLPNPIKIGIAPIMNGKPEGPFWQAMTPEGAIKSY